MNKSDFTNRAIRAIECVLGQGPAEDSYVEFKTVFPDVDTPESTVKVARQLAAHANAAAPDSFVWIIGVDEKAGKVVGANKKELSNWLSRIQRCFDGPSPKLSASEILAKFNKPIVVMLFDSSTPPYVVNLPNSRDRVIPWREGTAQRCTSRSELLELLRHHVLLPKYRIIEGSKKTNLVAHAKHEANSWAIHLHMTIYLENQVANRIVIPAHECSGWFEVPDVIAKTPFSQMELWSQKDRLSQTTIKDAEEVQIYASAAVHMRKPIQAPALVELNLPVVGSKNPLIVPCNLVLQIQSCVTPRELRTRKPIRATYFSPRKYS